MAVKLVFFRKKEGAGIAINPEHVMYIKEESDEFVEIKLRDGTIILVRSHFKRAMDAITEE